MTDKENGIPLRDGYQPLKKGYQPDETRGYSPSSGTVETGSLPSPPEGGSGETSSDSGE